MKQNNTVLDFSKKNKVNISEVIYQAKAKEKESEKGRSIKLRSVPEEIINRVREYLVDEHGELLSRSILDVKVRPQIEELISEFIRTEEMAAHGFTLSDLILEVTQEICGLGPLEPLVKDDSITEIMVNGPSEVWIERKGQDVKTDIKFRDDNHVMMVARKILNAAGEEVNDAKPLVDCRLPNSRVNIVIPPIARNGVTITIRKFPPINFSAEALIKSGLLNEEMLKLLEILVRGSATGIICGPTGSGKTTTMKKIFEYVEDNERMLTLEDTEEMRLKALYPDKHVVSHECRFTDDEDTTVTIDKLLKNALRQKPKRIIVGEVRGAEALTMIEAYNTGHEGGWTSMHAGSAKNAIVRLIMMILKSGVRMDSEMIGKLVADTVNVVVFQKKLRDGSRKILEISEVMGYKDGEPVMNDLYRYVIRGSGRGTFKRVGAISEKLADKLILEGVSEAEMEPFLKTTEERRAS